MISNSLTWARLRSQSLKFSKSDDSENIKIININSDESEQSNFSQNSQEEANDVSANLDDRESLSQMRR